MKLLVLSVPQFDRFWTFLRLPLEASEVLPSQGLVAVEGTFTSLPLQCTLLPDGDGEHWLRVDEELRCASGLNSGDLVSVRVTPLLIEPEPDVPQDLEDALETAVPAAVLTWRSISPQGRRDWIHWIVSGKLFSTWVLRIQKACESLKKLTADLVASTSPASSVKAWPIPLQNRNSPDHFNPRKIVSFVLSRQIDSCAVLSASLFSRPVSRQFTD